MKKKSNVLATIGIFLLAVGLNWGILIVICSGIPFKWYIAAGAWAILCIVTKPVFNVTVEEKEVLDKQEDDSTSGVNATVKK